MSEYKGIRGFKVQTLSTDPAASVISTGSWASGASINTTRGEGIGAGVQTAGIIMGGRLPPATAARVGNTEIYDGSSWTEVNDLNTARRQLSSAAQGTTTASLVFDGDVDPTITAATESWNGTSWTEVNDLPQAKDGGGGAGTQTAALAFTGLIDPIPSYLTPTAVQSWDGTNWTVTTSMNTGRYLLAGVGLQTAALAFGGDTTVFPSTLSSATESWNGTSWTTASSLNQAKLYVSGAGSYTAALSIGGATPTFTVNTEYYDGTTWTEVNNLATAVRGSMTGGTSSAAFSAGGFTSPNATSATEIWTTTATPSTFSKENLGQVYYNSTANAFKVTQQPVSAGAWASGGTMNTARRIISGAGTQTATVAMGGFVPPWVTSAELYNGSTWTTTTSINTARSGIESAGTQTAALGAGGYDGTTRLAVTEEWNGSTWTEVNDLNVGRSEGGSSINGTTTATIVFSGAADPPTPTSPKSTESYNGTSWTEVGDLSGPHIIGTGFGTQTAAIAAAGEPLLTTAELWDGTSWSSVSPINTGRAENLGSSGLSTSGLIFGGFTTTFVGNTESWDGSAWTEVADLATARDSLYGSGISSSALAFGGRTAPTTASAATEEWTVPIQNNTITVS